MQFQTTKNKLFKISNQQTTIDSDLTKKKNENQVNIAETYISKQSKVLYESDWLNLDGSHYLTSENYQISSINSDIDSTVNNGALVAASFNGFFKPTLNLPNDILKNVKTIIEIKKPIDYEVKTYYKKNPIIYNDYPYFKIWGDSNVIYKGYNSLTTFISPEDFENLDENLTSKWYKGTLIYTASGNTYKVVDGYIWGIKTFYDYTGTSFKEFECYAIDSLSSSSVTGTGTYATWSYTVETGWIKSDEIKNYTTTASLFGNVTHISMTGVVYENDIYQYYLNNYSPMTFKFSGSVNDYIPSEDKGYLTFSSFAVNFDEKYRLWWDSRRGDYVTGLNGSFLLTSKPNKNNYQDSTLPYTHLYVDVNPEGYPEQIHFTKGEQEFLTNRHVEKLFIKIDDINNYISKYQVRFDFYNLLVGPGTREVEDQIDHVDHETYSISGDTYARDAENRPEKYIKTYYLDATNIQIRGKVILTGMSDFSDSKKVNLK